MPAAILLEITGNVFARFALRQRLNSTPIVLTQQKEFRSCERVCLSISCRPVLSLPVCGPRGVGAGANDGAFAICSGVAAGWVLLGCHGVCSRCRGWDAVFQQACWPISRRLDLGERAQAAVLDRAASVREP